MQHEITQNGPLLNANGTLREPGWARSLLLDYRRADVKAGKRASRNGIITSSRTIPLALRSLLRTIPIWG